MDTRILYQNIIKETLINNKIRKMIFKGDNNFTKKYKHVDILFDGKKHSLLVYTTQEEVKFSQFYFDFTIDYAVLLEMIEGDLFRTNHKVPTEYFDFE